MPTDGRITAPYGAWRSPITAASLTAGGVALAEPRLDGDDIYWLEGRATEAGRVVLVRHAPDGTDTDVTPEPFSVRSRVHEYGGGAYAVHGGHVAFVEMVDQRLYVMDSSNAEPRAVTPAGELRYGGLVLDGPRGVVYCVREDHRGEGEAVNTLVRVDLSGDDAGGTVLVQGPDFVSRPALSADGSRLAWVQWDHPNMPWDDTALFVGDLDAAGALTNTRQVAGTPGECVSEPMWAPDGRLVFLSDRTGWANLYAVDATSGGAAPVALLPMEHEFGSPQWALGASSYGFAADRIVCSWLEGGLARVGVLGTDGRLTPLPTDATSVGSVQVDERGIVIRAGFADQPSGIVRVSLSDPSTQLIKSAERDSPDPALVSRPQPVEWTSSDGAASYGFYYAPTNPDYVAPEGQLPPLIVMCHGGPTAFSPGVMDAGIDYWTSRGLAVLDVNYGGSSGYGRAYRQRLHGNWGIVDVADCSSGAVAMAERGKADLARLAITGGSAGGFTTLAALAFTDVFTAGASYFGVSDLGALARDTHKFESRYLDGLVGPWPQAQDVYAARSPIEHTDGLSAPMILLQGTEDMVVPPNQALLMADAVRAKGLPVALLMFEGEGHGFRRADSLVRALEAEAYFYSKVFGFDLADDVPAIEIENLPEQGTPSSPR